MKRILLCRLGAIGDVMHTLPLVKYLRKEFQDTSIEYLTSPDLVSFLQDCCPYIDKVWAFTSDKKKQVACDILNDSNKIDYFFNLHSTFSFFIFNLFYIHALKYFQYSKDDSLHAAVNFAKTFKKNITALDLEHKTLCVGDADELLKEYGLNEGKYICFVPGVGRKRPHRAWTVECWSRLTEKFLSLQKDYKVVFLGGKEELRLIGYLPEVKDQTINLISRLNLQDVAKIISKAHSLFSCDTGLLHIASGLSVMVVGLYGPTQPARTGPFLKNYHLQVAKDCKCIGKFMDMKQCKITKKSSGYCMQSIEVDNVLNFLPLVLNEELKVKV